MINAKAPDTITEWVTSAFAVNPTSGLGVSSDIANVNIYIYVGEHLSLFVRYVQITYFA